MIVNWNSKDFLRQCLVSVVQHCTSVSYEIIVVDGASFDGCHLMLAENFPNVRFIQSAENIGFARANNLGAKEARGRALLLLNPDTLMIEDSISVLLHNLSSLANAGAVGCRLLNADRSLQMSCVLTFPTTFNRMLDSEYLRRRFPLLPIWGMQALFDDQPKPVEAISGACILIERECFVQIGGFTESYFMYGEDVDLCFKVWRNGKKVFHVPTTTVVHFGGGSSKHAASNFSTVLMRQSWYQFMATNRGKTSALFFRTLMGISAAVRLVFIPPLLVFGNRIVRHGRESLRKWYAVLKWSVGRAPKLRR